jgi:hypothetical protein
VVSEDFASPGRVSILCSYQFVSVLVALDSCQICLKRAGPAWYFAHHLPFRCCARQGKARQGKGGIELFIELDPLIIDLTLSPRAQDRTFLFVLCIRGRSSNSSAFSSKSRSAFARNAKVCRILQSKVKHFPLTKWGGREGCARWGSR